MRLRIRVLLHASRKPFQRPPKKGGGAPISASTGVRPAAEREACQRLRRAPSPRSTRTARDLRSGTLAFRRSTATLRRGSDLDSAPGRASWNHRIQTGGPSPAPVQPAPGSPVTRRTVDAQSRPDAGYKPASGNRARPIDRLSPVDVPSMGELALRNYNGDGCQGVSLKEGRPSRSSPPSPDLIRGLTRRSMWRG